MPKTFFISPLIPLLWLSACVVALGIIMLWIEWQRNVRFFIARIIAVMLSILALTGILLRPSFLEKQSLQPVALLTPNFSHQVVDSLKKQKSFDFINYNPDKGIDAYKKRIHTVVGEGIPVSVFHSHPDLSFRYHGPEQSSGITALKLSQAMQLQPLTIEGYFSGVGKKLLILSGPAGVEDSVFLQNRENRFSFKVTPKTSGNMFYYLVGKLNDKILFEEKVPVNVQPQLPLRILLLQSFPTFETRFLKTYLGERGHQLALRYQVSKNIYRYEYVNREEKPFEVNSELLTEMDLLIITEDVLMQMNKRTLSEITQAVQQGLGLLLLVQNADAELESTDLFKQFEFLKDKKDSTQLVLADISKRVSLPTGGLRIKNTPTLQTVFEDADGSIVGYTFFGRGKVGVQLIQDTYILSLGASMYSYASIWQPCIQKISRTGILDSHIEITTPAPIYKNQPIVVQIISNEANPKLEFQKQKIPLLENTTLQQVYETTIWPEQSGWNTLTLSDSTKLNFFVHEDGEWGYLKQAQQQKANRSHHSKNEIVATISHEQRPVSRILLFSILILSLGFLWLSSKL